MKYIYDDNSSSMKNIHGNKNIYLIIRNYCSFIRIYSCKSNYTERYKKEKKHFSYVDVRRAFVMWTEAFVWYVSFSMND